MSGHVGALSKIFSRFVAVLAMVVAPWTAFSYDGDGYLHTSVFTDLDGVALSIRNIDVSHFPEISLILDAATERTDLNLNRDNVQVFENQYLQKTLSVEKIFTNNRTAVDVVFVVDKTGSMKDKLDEVRSGVERFVEKMKTKGIDYRLSMVTFSDIVETVTPFTDSVALFHSWLDGVVAEGGGDDKENALEGLRTAVDLPFRTGAARVALLITDAPCHQKGELGDGTTDLTNASCARLMEAMDVRTFCITDPSVTNYAEVASRTGGEQYDIRQPFDQIIDHITARFSNLYLVKYASSKPYLPDTLGVQVVRQRDSRLLASKSIPVLEIGQKLVLDNIFFEFNSAEIRPASYPVLDRIVQMLRARPSLHIRVLGHSDSTGTEEYNFHLSQQRANAVKKYITESGVDERRIEPVGMGRDEPLASNDSEVGRQLNRRTEFIITQK